jgi:hypothetical protein
MQNDDLDKTYQSLLDAKIARIKAWSPEQRAKVEQDWADLFRDVEAVLETDPASAPAQALAKRWMRLLEEFAGPNQMRNDDTQAPCKQWAASTGGDEAAPYGNPRVWDFIAKALARHP